MSSWQAAERARSMTGRLLAHAQQPKQQQQQEEEEEAAEADGQRGVRAMPMPGVWMCIEHAHFVLLGRIGGAGGTRVEPLVGAPSAV